MLQFGLSLRPEEAVTYLTLNQRVSKRKWEPIVDLQPQQTGEGPETPGWHIELIGEVPIVPAEGEDISEYLQQDFHIIGTPDEYIEPEPDACTSDLNSLRFDFRFLPLHPNYYQ